MHRSTFSSIALVAFTVFAAGCSFDSSSLDARPPCASDEDCTIGVCVSGSCYQVETLDTGDTPSDAGLDAADAHADATDAGRDADRPDGDLPDAPADADIGGDGGVDGGGDTDIPDSTTCTPGETRCGGNTSLLCQDNGEFAVDEECLEGPCVDGACTVAECEPGELSCVGETLANCTDEGVAIVEAQCAESEAYCDPSPTPHCEPRACTPNALRCGEANDIQACDERGIGWSHELTCGEDELCADGECIPLECSPGVQRCVGPFVYATCNPDGQSSTVTPCESDEYCSTSGGVSSCLPQVCAPNSRRCSPDRQTAEICDERGTGYVVSIPCGDGQVCTAGMCGAQVCEPSSVACDGDFSYIECDELGTGGTRVFCDAGLYCDDDAEALCVPQICEPGSRVCEAATLIAICAQDGSDYNDNALCDEGTACLEGECVPSVCTPRDFRCSTPGVSEVCNDTGTAWETVPCGGETFCSDELTACVPWICTPGETTCDGNTVNICNDFGSGEELFQECEFTCSEGACQPNVCGDGIVSAEDGEQCDDGNDDPCDGCDACRLTTAISITPASNTISSTVYQAAETDITFEAWVKPTSNSGALFGIGQRTEAHHLWVGLVGGKVMAELSLSADDIVRVTGGSSVSDSEWHHVAVQRFAGSGLAIFIDGELDGLNHERKSATSLSSESVIWVGSEGTTTPASAHIDELRLSDVRRYTSRFTPAITHTPDANTAALYRFNEASISNGFDASSGGRNLLFSNSARVPDACYGVDPDARACGDGNLAPWEECDDGNTVDRDGCTACTVDVCAADEIRGPTDQCYWFRGARNWLDQRGRCRSRTNSGLVTINNALENTWIAFFLDLTDPHWIGLNDRGWDQEGKYKWSDGTSDYRKWAPGEPNNHGAGIGNAGEDCTVIYGSSDGTNASFWNDTSCGDSRPAICERTP